MRVLLTSFLFIPILLAGFLSIERLPEIPGKLFVTGESAPADTLLKMQRTICFGTCPSYTLSVLNNGKVMFNGKEFVDHKGLATGEMTPENVDKLIKKIRESHFMDIASNPDCESRMTDHPSVFLTIRLGDKQHSITHYQGCKGFQYEDNLYDLEETIDSLAGTKKWIEGTD